MTPPPSIERTAFELTENIPVGTYTMVQSPQGGMGRFAFMSRRFLELTGLTREEAISDPLKGFACVHPEDFDAWVELNARTFAEKTPFSGETRLLVNGEIRWIRAESIPRSLPDGSTVWEGVLADITDQKRFEQALLEAKQRAERLERRKTEFMANLSHEIRTPMNAVLGLTQLLLRERLEPRHLQVLRRIDDAGQLLLTLINDILDLSKIESGKMTVKATPFVLHELLDRVHGLYVNLLEGRPVEFRWTVADGTPVHLRGDVRRIEQILANLIGNAIKFTEAGRIELAVRTAQPVGGMDVLRFSIRDTGTGIAVDPEVDLFEAFQQGEAGRRPAITGTGLGLTISKRLVEWLGGVIGFESVPGSGSEFWFELPLARQDAGCAYPVERPKPVPHAIPVLHGARVMMVDASPLARASLLEFILALEGRPTALGSADEALRHLAAAPDAFAVILVSLQGPGVEGLEAAGRIVRDPRLGRIPVIALASGADVPDPAGMRAAGICDVLHKPLQLEDLAGCLQRWIGSSDPASGADEEARSQPVIAAGSSSTAEPVTEYPEVPGIDAAHARRITDGDAGFFRNLLEVFRSEYGDTPGRILEAIERGDFPEAARRLHALAGAAGYLGASRVAGIARGLENSVLREETIRPDEIGELAAALRVILNRVDGAD